MCFSASASFAAGTVLSVIGVITLKKVESRSQLPFASIPLLFAIQQISEGFLWLALSDPYFMPLKTITSYTFLFFAQIIWPVCVPLSIFLVETDNKRKTIQKWFVWMGAIAALYLAYCLANYDVQAKIMGQHISYEQIYPPQYSFYGGFLYIAATILPPLFSSFKGMKLLSLAVLISYIITNLFYVDYIVSVWCFFASIISIAVLVIVMKMKDFPTKKEPVRS